MATAAARPADERIEWFAALPFILIQASVLVPFITGSFSWKLVALCVGSYYLRMVGVTVGYHRYFSHRTFKTSRLFQFLLAFLAQTSTQKGALWWAVNHRHHHKFSDLDEDIHSPLKRGFWWSHIGWIMVARYEATDYEKIKDLAKFPELVWLNKLHWVPGVVYALAMFAFGGWDGLLWGYFISTALLYHGTFFINSLAHVIGSRRYETTDTSKNSMILALLTCGEGWHNNHHHYQSTANQGWFWWEIDVSYYVLRLLSLFGLVRELRLPPPHVLEGTIASTQRPVREAPDSSSVGLPELAAE